MIQRGMMPPHPGAMIKDVIQGIIDETGKELTTRQIAQGLGISARTLSNILNEHQGINSEMAIRLSEAFGSTPEFWLKLQSDYDLWHAEKRINRSEIQHFWPLPETELQSA